MGEEKSKLESMREWGRYKQVGLLVLWRIIGLNPIWKPASRLFMPASAVVQIVGAQVATDPSRSRVEAYRVRFSVPCTCQPSNSMLFPLLVPRFPNANVELWCGENYDYIIDRTRTNLLGAGELWIDAETALPFLPLESNCRVAVTTSLSTCNPALPSTGRLESSIRYGGANPVFSLFTPGIAEYTANSFQYNPYL